MQILIIEQYFLIMKRGPGVVVLKCELGLLRQGFMVYSTSESRKAKISKSIPYPDL